MQGIDLLRVLVRGVALELGDLPVEARGVLGKARPQCGRIGVLQVGDDQHRGRVLEEAIGHLL